MNANSAVILGRLTIGITALSLAFLAACGEKAPPAAPPVAAPVAPAPVAAPEPTPPPAPVEVKNADMNVMVTFADGTTKGGHVKRIERSTDFFGDEGWTTETKDLVISAEGAGAYQKMPWTQVKLVTVKAGAIPAEVDCVYDSNFTPWMYDCTINTVGTLTSADGKKWTVDNRHKWRFTFDDDSSVEFWLKKHPAREQDEKVVDLDTSNPENLALYTKLNARLRTEVKSSLVVKVEIK
jgi:hypothetical protein